MKQFQTKYNAYALRFDYYFDEFIDKYVGFERVIFGDMIWKEFNEMYYEEYIEFCVYRYKKYGDRKQFLYILKI